MLPRPPRLDEDAKVVFALNNALLDASISAWDAKRQWSSVRPITAVRRLKKDQLIQAWCGLSGAKTIAARIGSPLSQPTTSPRHLPSTPPGMRPSVPAAMLLKSATGSDTFGLSVTIPAGSSRVEPKT